MASPQFRKVCRVTAESPTSKTLTPTTDAKSPSVRIASVVVNTTGAPTDFWGGSGRYEVIVKRL